MVKRERAPASLDADTEERRRHELEPGTRRPGRPRARKRLRVWRAHARADACDQIGSRTPKGGDVEAESGEGALRVADAPHVVAVKHRRKWSRQRPRDP